MNVEQQLFMPNNFLETYERMIAPKLKEIDIFLKTCANNISIQQTACLLEISEEETATIMNNHEIDIINTYTFYTIMKHGSSQICRLFKRELDRGTPHIYTAEDISYIYNIDQIAVEKTCQELGLKEIPNLLIPILFLHLPTV